MNGTSPQPDGGEEVPHQEAAAGSTPLDDEHHHMNAHHTESSAPCTFTLQLHYEEPSKYDELVDYTGGEDDALEEVEP